MCGEGDPVQWKYTLEIPCQGEGKRLGQIAKKSKYKVIIRAA